MSHCVPQCLLAPKWLTSAKLLLNYRELLTDPSFGRAYDLHPSSKWLPIAGEPLHDDAWLPEFAEDMLTLRALSQTCRRLRAFALPLLWQIVHVDSVQELGRLRETLRVLPFVAQHVKVFLMRWEVPRLYSTPYLNKSGKTLLDFAFSDRSSLWAQFAKREGVSADHISRIVHVNRDTHSARAYFFARDGSTVTDPGKPPLIEGCDPSLVGSYDWALGGTSSGRQRARWQG